MLVFNPCWLLWETCCFFIFLVLPWCQSLEHSSSILGFLSPPDCPPMSGLDFEVGGLSRAKWSVVARDQDSGPMNTSRSHVPSCGFSLCQTCSSPHLPQLLSSLTTVVLTVHWNKKSHLLCLPPFWVSSHIPFLDLLRSLARRSPNFTFPWIPFMLSYSISIWLMSLL